MKRVAIVVQRCHESIAGGSESLAWQYALLLRGRYDVEVLSTTATDYVSWANALPPGLDSRDGIPVRRFPVTLGRTAYWHQLYERLQRDHTLYCEGRQTSVSVPPTALLDVRHGRWSLALQEDFIRHQGPYSEPLLRFLEANASAYHAILFIAYLFPTTYFGLQHTASTRRLLVPTLHDEPIAYLSALGRMARQADAVVWLSEAEGRLGRRLWGSLPGQVVAMPVHTDLVRRRPEDHPYLLYCGRVDTGKGCEGLIRSFLAFKEEEPSDLKLVLTGECHLEVPEHKDVSYRGFVSAEEKLALMAGARVFVMPSAFESLSVATLEAMAQETPILVNGRCAVLADHVRHSGAGRVYTNHASFCDQLRQLLADESRRRALGRAARRYVLERYQAERIREKLFEQVEGGTAAAPRFPTAIPANETPVPTEVPCAA
jgi:glycosyltransferase involved in cell wall biosynthesis